MNKQGHIISVTLLQIMIVPLDVSALTEFAVAEKKTPNVLPITTLSCEYAKTHYPL